MGDVVRGMLVAGGALVFGSAAFGFEYEVLFENADWRVDINLNDDETLTCEARTQADDAVTLSLYEEQDGRFTILFASEAWDFPSAYTETEFRIGVDRRTPWIMSGGRADNAISITPDRQNDDLSGFLGEIGNGRRLFLGNAAGDTIAAFSLGGSASSLSALAECAAMIRESAPQDPFAAAAVSDPFR